MSNVSSTFLCSLGCVRAAVTDLAAVVTVTAVVDQNGKPATAAQHAATRKKSLKHVNVDLDSRT